MCYIVFISYSLHWRYIKIALQEYVIMQNMKRSEVLDFLKRDYPEYAWSLHTLDRRMRYFDAKYINYETDENDGPGQLLGYRALHKKLREQHGLAVPRVFFPNST